MRALILVCLVAAANAAFTRLNVQEMAQPIVERAVEDFVAHLESGPGLAEFMGVPNNAFLESVEKATQTELGQQLSQQLSNVLAQIQSAIDHGQMVGQSLIDKAKELLQNLMSIGANVGQLAQQFLGELMQMGMLSLGNIFGKRELSGMINGLLSNVVGELQQALQNVIGVIQGVGNGSSQEKALIGNLLQNLQNQLQGALGQIKPLIQNLLGSIGKREISDDEDRALIGNLLQNLQNTIQNTIGQIKPILQNLLGNIGKRELGGMLNGLLSNVVGELQQALQNVIGVIQGVGNGSSEEKALIGNLLQNLQNQLQGALGQIKPLIQNLLGNLGKREISDERFIGDLLGNIGNVVNVLNQVQGLLGNLNVNQLLQGLLSNALGKREIGDERIWNLITDSIQSIISSMSGPLSQFQSWISQIMGGAGSVLQGHMSNIQQMAQEVLGHVNELTSNTVDQAVAFFKPYQNDLGALWGQLQQAAANIHAQVTG